MNATQLPTQNPALAPLPASARAISRIKAEHRALARVIGAMQSWVARRRESAASADVGLFSSMLRYIREVPDTLHHPREDGVLFPALAAVEEARQAIAVLQREHADGAAMLGRLAAVFQAHRDGAPNSLNALSTAVDEFAEFYWAHMRTEEEQILPVAERALGEPEWARVARAFCDSSDPLFRADAAAEYRRLYAYIASLSPVDLRAYLEEAAEGAQSGFRPS